MENQHTGELQNTFYEKKPKVTDILYMYGDQGIMSGNLLGSWNGQYDDPPPSYSLVAQHGHVSYRPSIFQILSWDEDPPPSYSSLDLTSDSPINQTTPTSLVQEGPNHTEATQIKWQSRGCQVPSYIGWSIFNVIFFPPIGLIALILSLKVLITRKRNNSELAWKSHVMARKVNIAATSLGIMAAMYYAIAVPLMFRSRMQSTRLTAVSHLGKA